MRKSEAMRDLEDLASVQWGMFTTAQAQELGVRRNQISRLVDSGRAERMSYGVYRYMPGDEAANSGVKAAWLSINPKVTAGGRLRSRPYDAVVTGRTAAYLHGIGDFYASPYTFDVSSRKQISRGDIICKLRAVDERDVVLMDSLPVASIELTVADLVRSHEDPSLVDGLMGDAARSGHVMDRDRLGALLERDAGRHGYETGDAFAADLISRSAAGPQVSRAADTMAQSLAAVLDAPGTHSDNWPHMKASDDDDLAKKIASPFDTPSLRSLTEKLSPLASSTQSLRRLLEPVLDELEKDSKQTDSANREDAES